MDRTNYSVVIDIGKVANHCTTWRCRNEFLSVADKWHKPKMRGASSFIFFTFNVFNMCVCIAEIKFCAHPKYFIRTRFTFDPILFFSLPKFYLLFKISLVLVTKERVLSCYVTFSFCLLVIYA